MSRADGAPALSAGLRWAADIRPPEVARCSGADLIASGGELAAAAVAVEAARDEGADVTAVSSLDDRKAGADPSGRLAVFVGDGDGRRSGIDAAAASGAAPALVGASRTSGGRRDDIPFLELPGPLGAGATVGHVAGVILRILEAAGIVRSQATGLREAADVVDGLLAGGAGPAVALAQDLADAVGTSVPVVWGRPGIEAAAGLWWSVQMWERAGVPGRLLVVGAGAPTAVPETGITAIRLVGGPGQDDPIPELARASGVRHGGEVRAQGGGVLARLFSFILVGDMVADALAEIVRRAGPPPRRPSEAPD